MLQKSAFFLSFLELAFSSWYASVNVELGYQLIIKRLWNNNEELTNFSIQWGLAMAFLWTTGNQPNFQIWQVMSEDLQCCDSAFLPNFNLLV